jgi:hypothetical protein
MRILVPKLQLLKITVEPKPPLLKIGIAGQKLLPSEDKNFGTKTTSTED